MKDNIDLTIGRLRRGMLDFAEEYCDYLTDEEFERLKKVISTNIYNTMDKFREEIEEE